MSTKKGKKSKGTTLSLQEFNSRLEDKAPAAGQNVIYAPKKKPGQMTSWADEVEDDDYYEKERIFLPSAPRAVRGPAYDDSEIPREAPFKAHLGNLSYDINNDDVYKFFRDLDVVDLRLPRDENSNRLRGFGHVEFGTRQDLVEALIRNEQMLMGRPVRISLGSSNSNRNDDRRGDRPGGERGGSYHPDETPDDWRSAMSTGKSDFDSQQQGPPSFGRRGDRDDRRDRDDRPRRDFDRREMYGGGPRSDSGRDRDDYGEMRRDGRRDNRDNERGPRDRSHEEEGPADWRSSMKPREPPREEFVRLPSNPPINRIDMEPPFERRPPEERRRRPSHEEPPREEPRRERKKLTLAPRTVPVPPGESAPEAATASIFGGAKPVDTAAREREIEEKMAQVAIKPKEESPSPREPRERDRSHDEPTKQFSDSDEGDHEDDRGSRHDLRQQREQRDLTAPPAVNPWSRRPQPEQHDNYRRDNHGPDRKTPDSDRNGEKEKDSHSEPEDDRDISHHEHQRFIVEKTFVKDGEDDDFRQVESRDRRDWGRDRGDRDGRSDRGNWHSSGPRRGGDGRNVDAGPRRNDGRGFDDRRSSGLRDNRDRENNRDSRRGTGGGGHMMDRDYRGDNRSGSGQNRMERGSGGGSYNSIERNVRGGQPSRAPTGGERRGGGERGGSSMDKGLRDNRSSSGRMGPRDDYYRDSDGFQELRGTGPPRNMPKHIEDKPGIPVAAQNKYSVLDDQDVGSD